MLRYVEAVRSQPQGNRKTLYGDIFVEPIWARFVSGGEFERNLPKERLAPPPEDAEGIARIAASIRDSDIKAVGLQTLRKLSEMLPGPDTALCILPADPADAFVNRYMRGVSGAVVGAGRIALVVSSCPGWLDRVPAAIAHEYHHSVWLYFIWSQVPSFDLLNYLIFEGRACHFAEIVFPGTPAPWTRALTPEQESEQWRNMRCYLDEDSHEAQARFMFGCETVPLCAGYTIGFRIVQCFLQRNPHMTVRQWTLVSARDVLDGSHYDPCGPRPADADKSHF